MKSTYTRIFRVRTLTAMTIAAVVLAMLIAFTVSAQADGHGSAELSLSASEAQAGDVITVEGSGYRVGGDGSFIYTSTITIGGVPVAGVVNVGGEGGAPHRGRVTDSGLHIAEHIDVDAANGAFTADIVVPDGLAPGEHYLEVTSCWGGADDAYPQDGVMPCGAFGLGGGVNDVVGEAPITILAPSAPDLDTAELSLSASEAEPGDVITVEGSGFRVGGDGSFIYTSTITVGGIPVAGVVNVGSEGGTPHYGRVTDSGLHIAGHIDVDSESGSFTADIVVPEGLTAGDHYVEAISCYGGPDDAYPQDGVLPCGAPGLGGGVNDRVGMARLTIIDTGVVATQSTPQDTARLSLSASDAVPGDVITVDGSGFRVGGDGSFIYTSTITVGSIPVAGVVNVGSEGGTPHRGRVTDSGLHIAEHIDVDSADGAFTADIVVPYGLPAGDHYLKVVSCWGGADDAYPQDGVGPCGSRGLGGGVNDRVATAHITVTPATAELSLTASEAQPGDVITVEGSGFRVGGDGSFIYTSTITVGGVPVAGVVNVGSEGGTPHYGRVTDSGLHIAGHIDVDSESGAFTADIVVPDGLSAGEHRLEVTSCWGGPTDAYPQDGVAPCGASGLGGGVNDRVARAAITVLPSDAELTIGESEAKPGDTITVHGSGFRVGMEASYIYTSTITVGGMPIARVKNVDPASGYLHAGRPGVAEHIDIDPAGTDPDGAFTAEFVLPSNLPAGEHYLRVTSCWGGSDESYPEDGIAPCGTPGLGGGVNDRVATAHLTVKGPTAMTTPARGPRGPMGPQGEAGPEGVAGPAGAAGQAGARGPAGPAGSDGSPGESGPAGPAGRAGPQGPAGSDGGAGRDGAIGPAGPQGPAGSQGPTGPGGLTGADGPDGSDGGGPLAVVSLIVAIVSVVAAGGVFLMRLGRRGS